MLSKEKQYICGGNSKVRFRQLNLHYWLLIPQKAKEKPVNQAMLSLVECYTVLVISQNLEAGKL